MFGWFSHFGGNSHPYKVQNANDNIKKGIVADSLRSLIKKSKKALQITDIDKLVLEDDGTEVDDEQYFTTLPPQTVFVALQKGENWQLDKSKALKSVLNALSSHRNSETRTHLLSELHRMLRTANSPQVVQFLSNMTNVLETNIATNTPEEDENWFKGVETRFKSKEDVMKDLARRRIRSYYYTAKDYVKSNSKKSKDVAGMLTMLLDEYRTLLNKNDYYGHFFARSNLNKDKFCDSEGWFTCEGAFNEENCDDAHMINPYASRSDRIIFSTWNLDHQIEKSREVLPCLWEAVLCLLKNSRLQMNHKYFYDLLFTRLNLRIVHVACHDKKQHSDVTCDRRQFYK